MEWLKGVVDCGVVLKGEFGPDPLGNPGCRIESTITSTYACSLVGQSLGEERKKNM